MVSSSPLMLWHGAETAVERPAFGPAAACKDFGPGFCCADSFEAACERIAYDDRNGVVSRYSLETSGLRVIDLTKPPYSPLHWLSVLVRYRILPPRGIFPQRAAAYLPVHFPVAVDEADVIIGHFADDSRFAYAVRFLTNSISLEQLSCALKLAPAGRLICIRTDRALERMTFLGSECVCRQGISEKIRRRDLEFRRACSASDAFDFSRPELVREIFIMDILREEIDEHDTRLR